MMMIARGILMLALLIAGGHACDCSDNQLGQTDGFLGDGSLLSYGGSPGDTLEEVLSPQLLQTYIAMQLQKIGEDIASMTKAQERASAEPCASTASSTRPLRRFRRLAPLRDSSVGDVPVVAGLAAGAFPRALRTTSSSSSSLAALKSKTTDNSGDVPVFKGTADNSQVRLVNPTPATARLATPAVPVVKGSADPAHPGRRGGAGLQLSPEEEQALAVLMEGRSRAPASVLSGKVGAVRTEDRGNKQSRPSRPRPSPSPIPNPNLSSSALPQEPKESPSQPDCCSQRRLLAELERQLALLRRLNAEHAREEEWARANTLPGSYPSPYFPYLHNLPIHPARGMDDSTYYSFPGRPGASPGGGRGPMYFLPVAGPQPARGPQSQGVIVRPRGATGWRALGVMGPPSGLPAGPRGSNAALDGWGCAEKPTARAASSAGRIDDKVKFNEQQQQRKDKDTEADDDSIAAKLGEAIDVEI